MDVTIECICPPTADGEPRHEQDTITFKETFSFHEVVALQKDMAMAGSDDDATVGDSLAALTEGYIVRGITSWTVVDARGKAVTPNRAESHRTPAVQHQRGDGRVGCGRGTVQPVGAAPFSEQGLEAIRYWADGVLDVSTDGLAKEAPEAIEAILDLNFPDGRHRDDFTVARWRLQVIAERDVGAPARLALRQEDAKVTKLRRASGGHR